MKFCEVLFKLLLLNAKPELQWQILNKTISQTFSLHCDEAAGSVPTPTRGEFHRATYTLRFEFELCSNPFCTNLL
jgi:hypothetical protein